MLNPYTKISVSIFFSIFLAACTSTPHPRSDELPWALSPELPINSRLAICVRDLRPKVETEKEPTTEYLYTGSVSPVENHAEYLAKDFGDVIIRSGGAYAYTVSSKIDFDADVFILFKMKHWFGKMKRLDLDPGSNLTIADGEFGGEILIYRKGVLIAQEEIHCDATPIAIDLFTPLASQRENTPQLILKGLGLTANDAMNCGIHKMMDCLESIWDK
ncbi:hypothetical protein P3T73_07390 [Kiritimatiellota bacterium B12222]|nr:hypothetical protein P3T73_07390 [Kiritimatiellota bacterium B12222]